jgi:hypothetical protein
LYTSTFPAQTNGATLEQAAQPHVENEPTPKIFELEELPVSVFGEKSRATTNGLITYIVAMDM